MPRKNAVKTYCGNSYYHIYNRGVEKRLLFIDDEDCRVFLTYLKDYLTPKDEKYLRAKLADSNTSYKERHRITKRLALRNYFGKITLVAFVLMPNHFHFLIKQSEKSVIHDFMHSLCLRYTIYFNKKYKRVGHLFEGVYKAVLVENDEQLLELTRYIHKQSVILFPDKSWQQKYPSSLKEYLGLRRTSWIHPEEILSFFSRTNRQLSYESFLFAGCDDSGIAPLLLEDD